MTSGVIITLIICGSLVLMSAISAYGKAHERKQVIKQLDEFKKTFPQFKDDNNDNDNDYFKKF